MTAKAPAKKRAAKPKTKKRNIAGIKSAAVAVPDPQLRPAPGVVTSATRPIVLSLKRRSKQKSWLATVDYQDGLPPRQFYTLGPRVITYIEAACTCTNAHWDKQPLTLLDWQKDWLVELFEIDPETGLRRYREFLLGLPKKNGKSEFMAALGHYFLEMDGEPAAKIIIAGAGEASADKIFQPAVNMVRNSAHARSPGVLAELTVAFENEIQVAGDPASKMFRVAGSPKASEGENVSHALLDEWHEWDEPRLEKNAIKIENGTVSRRQPIIGKITTPGWDLSTYCGRDYKYGVSVAAGAVDDRRYFFRWFAAPEDTDPIAVEYKERTGLEYWRSEDAIAAANPSYPDLMSWEFYEDKQGGRAGEPEPNYRRYFLGQWTAGDETWLPPGVLAACTEPALDLIPGAPTHIGLDASSRYDSTAIVAGQKQLVPEERPIFDENGVDTGGTETVDVERHVFRAWIWERPLSPNTRKPDEEWIFPWEEEIMPRLFDLIGMFDVWALQFDPAFFTHEAQMIADRWDPDRVLEFPQIGMKMEVASQEIFSACRNRIFAYDGDEGFTRHLNAAVAVQSKAGRGAMRLVKGRAKSFMDAAIALAMAEWSIAHVPAPRKVKRTATFYVPGAAMNQGGGSHESGGQP